MGHLRGPVAILFISRDTCSDSIAKIFCACFCGGYRTIIARYVAKWGIAQMCLCETKYQAGGLAPFWGSARLPEKVSRDMGYRSDSIARSRDMGPPSGSCRTKTHELLDLRKEGKGTLKKSIASWGVTAFLQDAPKKLSASKRQVFPQNFREVSQIGIQCMEHAR